MRQRRASAWAELVERLDEQHGHATRDPLPLGNKRDPYDELIYILLTVMTRSQPRIDRAFDALDDLRHSGPWSALLDVDPDHLRRALTPLGFVNRRTDQLLRIIDTVQRDYGGTLDPLRRMSDVEALAALTALPGVGVKTAKCVLMYSLDRRILPVDIHVLRVVKRLGLVEMEATWAEADEQLEIEVPPDLKFDLHVQLVRHGREICKGPNPQCGGCVLLEACPTGTLAPRRRLEYTSSHRQSIV